MKMTESTVLASHVSNGHHDHERHAAPEAADMRPNAREDRLKESISSSSPARPSSSSGSSDLARSPNAANQEQPQSESSWLAQLAKQLEFYFSPSNLARDVYLQTIRGSHDGCVPVSILANFAKVTSLCPPTHTEEDRIGAVCTAVNECSDLLEVVSLSQKTLRRVSMEQEGIDKRLSPRLLAIGLVSTAKEQVLTPPQTPTRSSAVQNTIILRDVSSNVKEEDVRILFDMEGCPPIKDVHSDVANCWFVTLDTSSRDDMVNAMLGLRSKTLDGEPLKARLKSVATIVPSPSPAPTPVAATARSTSPAAALPLAALMPPFIALPSPTSTAFMMNAGTLPTLSPRVSKKHYNRMAPGKSPRGFRGRPKQKKKNPKNGDDDKNESTPKLSPRPLSVDESHFPALPPTTSSTNNTATTTKLVDNMDEVHKTNHKAETGSTATTKSDSASSSSLLSKENGRSFASAAAGANSAPKPAKGGYAAALLKGSTNNKTPSSPVSTSAKMQTETKKEELSSSDEKKETETNETKQEVKEENLTAKVGSESPTSVVEAPSSETTTTTTTTTETSTPVVKTTPSAWGRGRSFADVVSSS